MASLSLRSVSLLGSSINRPVVDRDHLKMKLKMKTNKRASSASSSSSSSAAAAAAAVVVAMAVPKFKGTQMREKQLTEMIERKVKEATQVCEGDQTSDECKVAWDEVEEISQAKADFRRKLEKEDPLESFCQDHPETDECRVYDN